MHCTDKTVNGKTQISLGGGRKRSEEISFLYSYIFHDSWGTCLFLSCGDVHSTLQSGLLCCAICWAELSCSKSFFLPLFFFTSFRSLGVERHRGSVWKLEVMLLNPLAFEYTGADLKSTTFTHVQLPNKDIHKEKCVQIQNIKENPRLVPAYTYPVHKVWL